MPSCNRDRRRRTGAAASVVERLEVRRLFAAPGADWKLVWGDEFNGTHVDSSKWNIGKSWAGADGDANSPDPGTISYFTANNVSENGGMLHLAVRQQTVTDSAGSTFNYTGAYVNTLGKFQMSSGYVEVRAQIPTAPGTWPAFWMVSSGWPPEDDVMEYVTGQDRFHQGLAYGTRSNVHWDDMNTYTPIEGGFHAYGMEWGPGYQIFTMDGIITHVSRGRYVPNVPMYLMLNTGVPAVSPPTAGTVLPSTFDVDYVHVYQRSATPEVLYGGFEGGALGPWAGQGNALVTSDNPHSGSYALRLQGDTSEAQQTITGLKPNTTYVITAYAAAADGNQGTVGVTGFGWADVTGATTGSNYSPITLVFKTGRANRSATVYGLQSEGTGYVWIDDVAIHQAATITNPGFEFGSAGQWDTSGAAGVVAGHAHGGRFSLQATAVGDQASQTIYGLSPNTTYRLTAWVRVGSADDQASVAVIDDAGTEAQTESSATRYKQLAITFTTSATSTSATIVCSDLAGSSSMWFDDLSLTVPRIPVRKART